MSERHTRWGLSGCSVTKLDSMKLEYLEYLDLDSIRTINFKIMFSELSSSLIYKRPQLFLLRLLLNSNCQYFSSHIFLEFILTLICNSDQVPQRNATPNWWRANHILFRVYLLSGSRWESEKEQKARNKKNWISGHRDEVINSSRPRKRLKKSSCY